MPRIGIRTCLYVPASTFLTWLSKRTTSRAIDGVCSFAAACEPTECTMTMEKRTHYYLDETIKIEDVSANSTPDVTIQATCHCGAISVTAPRLPKYINECQCTICRRYGAAWIYYNTQEVVIRKKQGSATCKYVWGGKELEFHWCSNCGCIMYWWPVEVPGGGNQMGINSRMMDPDVLKNVTRKIDYDALFM